MGTAPVLVPVEEYLATNYDPDCDYVDGQVMERNMGERDHSHFQISLGAFLHTRRKELGIVVLPEQRVQITPTRYRIPDLCLIEASALAEQIVRTPPILCIEILSPGDTIDSIQKRLDDYFAIGVPCVWVVNPRSRHAWIYSADGIVHVQDGILRTPDNRSVVPMADLFE